MSSYHNILVAFDGSADAEAALQHAVALANDQNARLTLLTCDVPLPVKIDVAPAPGERLDLRARILRDGIAKIPADVSVTTLLRSGDAAASILAVAAEGGHDLIVMGSHGHSRLHRALLGSVSERVLREAASPVLLMRAERATP